MSNKQWISAGVTLVMIILGVILIKFLGLWTSIIALCSYFVGKIVGSKTTEPEIIEKIVEKIVGANSQDEYEDIIEKYI